MQAASVSGRASRAGARPRAMRRRIPPAAGILPVMPMWELIALGFLLAAHLTADALFGHAGQNVMNIAGPVTLAIILGLSVVRLVAADFSQVWTPLVWFRLACASYYGFGSLVPLIISDIARARILSFFRFFSDDLTKANILFVLGIIVTLVSANLVLRATAARRPVPAAPAAMPANTLLLAGLAFLVVGGAVKYMLVVPDMFGIIDFVLPGSFKLFGKLTSASLFLLTAWSWRYARGLFPLVTAFAGLEMLVGLLAFAKAEVLIALMMFLLGILTARVTIWRLALAACAVFVCYFTIIPLVNFGRAELFQRYGELGRAQLDERIAILQLALDAPPIASEEGSLSRGVTRLSYANQATFAIHQYDSNVPGNSYRDLLAVFVPRVLWPEKPIITRFSNEFNLAATGNPNSASGPGLFGEAYWNFGWTGLLVLIPVGAIFAILSRYSLWIVRSNRWFYFPVVLLALQVGFRVDGFLVSDVIGLCALIIALHLLLTGVTRGFLPIFQGAGLRSAPRSFRAPMPTPRPPMHHRRW